MNNAQTEIIQNHLDRMKHLPEPGSDVLKGEFHPRLQSMFGTIRRVGIVRKVGKQLLDNGEYVYRWQVDPDAYATAQECLATRDEHSFPALPCGDHGFANEGDRLACQFDDCEGAWTKAELRHFWDHGALPTAADRLEVVASD